MRKFNIHISDIPFRSFIIFILIFIVPFLLFLNFASAYVPVFFGEKIESRVVGIDSNYHKGGYGYYPILEIEKKEFPEKRRIRTMTKKQFVKIGRKSKVYYLKDYGVVDPKDLFLSNVITIVLFIITFFIGLAFYLYIKDENRYF